MSVKRLCVVSSICIWLAPGLAKAQVEPIKIHRLPPGEYFRSDEEAAEALHQSIFDMSSTVLKLEEIENLSPGDPLSREKAEQMLYEDLRGFRGGVKRYLDEGGPKRFAEGIAHIQGSILNIRRDLEAGVDRSKKAIEGAQQLLQSQAPWVREYATQELQEGLPRQIQSLRDANEALNWLDKVTNAALQRYERDLNVLYQLYGAADHQIGMGEVIKKMQFAINHFLDHLSIPQVIERIKKLEANLEHLARMMARWSGTGITLQLKETTRDLQRWYRQLTEDSWGSVNQNSQKQVSAKEKQQ